MSQQLHNRTPLVEYGGLEYKLVESKFWGSYYVSTGKPSAKTDVSFQLREGFTRLPGSLWTAVIRLFQHFANKTDSCLEVGVYLLFNPSTEEWRVVVPRQEVSGASVRVSSFDDCVDLMTGEQLESFPPPGWIHAGDCHSHNSMGAFYSGVDDASDVGQPGMHLVVGKVKDKSYEVCASIVQRQTRFNIDVEQLVEIGIQTEDTFHPKVLDYVVYMMSTLAKPVIPPAKFPTKIKTNYRDNHWRDYAYMNDDFMGLDEVEEPTSLSQFVGDYERGVEMKKLERALQTDPVLAEELFNFICSFSDFVSI